MKKEVLSVGTVKNRCLLRPNHGTHADGRSARHGGRTVGGRERTGSPCSAFYKHEQIRSVRGSGGRGRGGVCPRVSWLQREDGHGTGCENFPSM